MGEGHERVELRTERLTLRPFRLEDADDVFEYASDDKWLRHLPRVSQPYTRKAAEEFVARQLLTSWETDPVFAIVLGGKGVGSIGFRVDQKNEIASVGYRIAREHWGKGLMPEAAKAVIGWAFREYGLAKVYTWTDSTNTQSQRVMEKLGMTREGVLRSHGKGRDGRVDQVHYGILREEWVEPNG